MSYCWQHRNILAVGECSVCGKPVCQDCCKKVDGLCYCVYHAPMLSKETKKSIRIGCLAIVMIVAICGIISAFSHSNNNSTNSYSTSDKTPSPSYSSYSSSSSGSSPVTSSRPSRPQSKDAKAVQTLSSLLKEFPSIASIPSSTMLDIYHDYEDAFNYEGSDPYKDSREYEKDVDRSIAEKYGITEEQASLVYMFTGMNYSAVVSGASLDSKTYTLPYGTFLDIQSSGSTVVVKAEITSSLTNTLTIEQNYFNACDLIRNQGLDIYDEVQYWAIHDMSDGTKSKVISFTVPKDVIDLIATTNFPDASLGDYVDDLWIHPALKD